MKDLILICYDKLIQKERPDEIKDGDRYFDGEEIKVVAEDFIGLGRWAGVKDVVEVAVKSPPPEAYTDEVKEIVQERVRYDIRTLQDSLWIPTIEQMLRLIDMTLLIVLVDLNDKMESYPEYFSKDNLLENLIKYYLGTCHGVVYIDGRRVNTTYE